MRQTRTARRHQGIHTHAHTHIRIRIHRTNPIEHVYLGEVLARYPHHDYPDAPLNSANVLSFCFPDRLRLRAAYALPTFHTFALTNEIGYVASAVRGIRLPLRVPLFRERAAVRCTATCCPYALLTRRFSRSTVSR